MKARLTLLFVTLFPFFLLAQVKKPVVLPPPAWASMSAISYTDTHLDGEAEDGYVDLDYEQQTSLEHTTSYFKKSIRILTEAGVENSSRLSFDFDPVYEQLIFHTIRIIRNGTSINKLRLSQIKVIQQEKELDLNIYNGSLTAVLLLDDVRKGDVIEYSYSLKGVNPVFKNKYAHHFYVQYNVPLYHNYVKLIAPKERKLNFKNYHNTLSPSVQTTATSTTYEWHLSNSAAIRNEKDLPPWYEPLPFIMVSEWQSWQEVVNWAVELFPAVNILSKGLQEKMAEIQKGAAEEEMILRTLHFVQDEIRYMGVEMGENSHKPHTPDKVFAQRFGDCKDKAYLLCSMLKALHIDAYPVMINTIGKQAIGNWLPSPYAFDHVTVLIKTSGKDIWVDPTISYQRGSLQAISFPDYKTGLVIADYSKGLTSINKNNYGKVHVQQQFDVKAQNGGARLKVKTVFTGSFADDARYEFNTSSKGEIQKTYKDFYANYFKDIRADSISFADSLDGRFISYEYYTVPKFWKTEKGIKNVDLQSYLVCGLLKRPTDKNRSFPTSIKFPANYREEVKVNFPEDWEIEESETKVANANFRYLSRFAMENKRTCLMTFEYENLKDCVNPDEMDAYEFDMEKVDASLAYNFTHEATTSGIFSGGSDFSTKGRSNYSYLYVLLFVCVLITYIVRRVK